MRELIREIDCVPDGSQSPYSIEAFNVVVSLVKRFRFDPLEISAAAGVYSDLESERRALEVRLAAIELSSAVVDRQ